MWSTLTKLALFTSTFASALPSTFSRRDEVPTGTVVRECTKPGVMALTFDDGPWRYTSDILSQLKEAGANATFFPNGNNYGCIYDSDSILFQALEDGHQIGSHTWSHESLTKLTPDEIREEMGRLDNAFSNIIGLKPRYMRPPYGSYDDESQEVLADMGYRLVIWDIDSGDSVGADVEKSKENIIDAGTSGNGHILLMHDPMKTTAEELVGWVLEYAKENELQLVTVAECLGDEGGPYDEAAEPTDDTSCD